MPYEAVADDEHVVRLTELHELVCKLKVVDVLLRMYLLVLHAVLCNDRVEVLLHEFYSCGVDACDLPSVEGSSDVELAFECILDALWLLLLSAADCDKCRSCKCENVFHNVLVISSFFDFFVDLVDNVVLKLVLRDYIHSDEEEDSWDNACEPEDTLLSKCCLLSKFRIETYD